MKRVALVLTVSAALAAAVACRSVIEVPGGTSSVTPTSSLPLPSPVSSFGDGHSGPLTLSSGEAPRNLCHGLVSASNATATVSDASGFLPGDALLFWQVTTPLASPQDSTPLAAVGAAGEYEIVRLGAVQGNQLSIGLVSGTGLRRFAESVSIGFVGSAIALR